MGGGYVPERVEHSPALGLPTKHGIVADGRHVRPLLQRCDHGCQRDHLGREKGGGELVKCEVFHCWVLTMWFPLVFSIHTFQLLL